MTEREKTIQKTLRMDKIIHFFMTYTVPPMFIIILLPFQFDDALPYNYENFFYLYSTDFIFIILISGLLSFAVIFLSYKFLIPYIQKAEDASRIISLNIFLMAWGPMIVGLIGLLIGIYGYFIYNVIDWFTVAPFLLVSYIYGIYLHRKIIPVNIERYKEFELTRNDRKEDKN